MTMQWMAPERSRNSHKRRTHFRCSVAALNPLNTLAVFLVDSVSMMRSGRCTAIAPGAERFAGDTVDAVVRALVVPVLWR
jgi:hypothetical protein